LEIGEDGFISDMTSLLMKHIAIALGMNLKTGHNLNMLIIISSRVAG